ncbi:MAG: 4-hydroxy-tetrahydrodipicolinate reductase [Betaproteobacteria bacterium RIFCSPLOWO2_12_FULL_68_20]|nr:MAG: 4-hydroxy-tetrahydrodipicolinate reductase [Betaproteobacteria bacterium RIFCSPLOWO2_12_FULL_68_20]
MKLAIAGAGGRMGRALVEAALQDRELTVAAALEVAGSPMLGRDVGGVKVGSDIAAAVDAADVLLDFTRPEGTLAHLDACVKLARPVVVGTTGFSPAQKARIAEAGKRVAIVMSPNFAVGVNVAFSLAGAAAKALGEAYDVEIVEAHHRRKADAPSGTALKLGEVIARSLGRDLGAVAVYGRKGETGERHSSQIGFHAIRGGDIVGEHTVIFAGEGERVELTVRSQSRATYALGALRAAKWLKGRPAGLYDMADVLGLK